ncbi:hypothetical protein [Streptomyces sp. NPDC057794]
MADLTAKAVDLVGEGRGEQRYAEATKHLRAGYGSLMPVSAGFTRAS